MSSVNPQIEESWKEQLEDEFRASYFSGLKSFLQKEKEEGKILYPPGKMIFSAFNHTPFERVKVVIIGQDPYHGPGQAHGLSFSVPEGVKPPPSLVNIFKEIRDDIGIPVPQRGNLEHWANQGVLLLNATLTVRANEPASHQGKGWEQFTDAVIRRISAHRENVVFLLWGKFAQAKAEIIDTSRHYILKAAHPSPYSASNGFFGCRHFSKTNQFLEKTGQEPIDWTL